MASLWRGRKAGLRTTLDKKNIDPREIAIPANFRCPISLDLMKDPVMTSTGITYDRESIEAWLRMGNTTCPVTNQELEDYDHFIPNHSIRRMIQDWCVTNRPHGIERIPTPEIPVTGPDAAEMLLEIAAASRRGDCDQCQRLAWKMKGLAQKSERNQRCFRSNGAGRVLATSFSAFAAGPSGGSVARALEDILTALSTMFPLDEDALSYISMPDSLNSIVSIMKHSDFAGKLSAILMVKEVLASINGEQVDEVSKTEGLIEALLELIKEPISPQITKISLVAVFYMVSSSSSESTAQRFVSLGSVPLIMEMLVDAEKSVCEKALGVLDMLLSCAMGREEAYSHALAMPVLVKKVLRVSDTATEFSVSALWKLCKSYKENDDDGEGGEECLVQALQVGAFQKLLLLLQVGCNEATKEKATELLKLLNGYRSRAECIDTMDFKGLKR